MSSLPSRSEEKAILPPSGDQVGQMLDPGGPVIFTTADPSARMT